MMAKEKTIVNGYTVPGGYGGVAVRRACEVILNNPGISQKELLEHAVACSGLGSSTAGWIVSPGNSPTGKSPATRLWDRRKEDVFRCYPNEFTDRVVGSQEAILEELLRWTATACKKNRPPVVGGLYDVWPRDYLLHRGMVLGFTLGEGGALYPTAEDALASRKGSIMHWERIGVSFVESGGSNKIHSHSLVFEYRPV
jgi:hypothetical protein